MRTNRISNTAYAGTVILLAAVIVACMMTFVSWKKTQDINNGTTVSNSALTFNAPKSTLVVPVKY